MGHKRTHASQQVLFDHPVGAGEKAGAGCEADGLCRLEVNRQLCGGSVRKMSHLEPWLRVASAFDHPNSPEGPLRPLSLQQLAGHGEHY